MRSVLFFLSIVTFLNADKMVKNTLGCPSVVLLQKLPVDTGDNNLKLNMYAIANSCVVISKKDKVKAVGYDPLNSKEIFQKVIYKKTGEFLYILRSTIQVEQDGKKGVVRF